MHMTASFETITIHIRNNCMQNATATAMHINGNDNNMQQQNILRFLSNLGNNELQAARQAACWEQEIASSVLDS